MKITVVAVGKLKDSWIKEGCQEYAARIARVNPIEIIEEKNTMGDVRTRFARAQIWLLDRRGKELGSEELAEQLSSLMNRSVVQLVFAIGGPDGFDKEEIGKADRCWSLGKMTLPHRIARLVVLEQIYRAFSILRREPYHRE